MRRKQRRIQEAEKSLISLEQLREMGESDPCSKEIYERIYEEEKAKMQRENISKLKMKSFRTKNQHFEPEQFIPPEKVQKVVVKQSLAGKFFSNVSWLFSKE